MDKFISFLKSVPKWAYFTLVIIVSFVGMLQYQKYEEAKKIDIAEKRDVATKSADSALEKTKEVASVSELPTVGSEKTGVKNTVSSDKYSAFSTMIAKFAKPQTMTAGDFESTASGILLTKNGAWRLGIRYDGNLIPHINEFLNGKLPATTTITNKGFSFTFDNTFTITAASVPGVPDKAKYEKLKELYTGMVQAYQTKTDFSSNGVFIKADDLATKIPEVKKALVESQRGTTSQATTEYNGNNIVEVIGKIKVD